MFIPLIGFLFFGWAYNLFGKNMVLWPKSGHRSLSIEWAVSSPSSLQVELLWTRWISRHADYSLSSLVHSLCWIKSILLLLSVSLSITLSKSTPISFLVTLCWFSLDYCVWNIYFKIMISLTWEVKVEDTS